MLVIYEACADYGKQQKNVELIPKMVKHGHLAER
jgi:hypothetical protein